MIVKIVGYTDIDFINKEGKRIVGTTVFGTFKKKNSNVYGEMCKKFFFDIDTLQKGSVSVGDELFVTYDDEGKVDTVRLNDSDVDVS